MEDPRPGCDAAAPGPEREPAPEAGGSGQGLSAWLSCAERLPWEREHALDTLALLAPLRSRETVAELLLERSCALLRADAGALLGPLGEGALAPLAGHGPELDPFTPVWAAARTALAGGKSAAGPGLWGAGVHGTVVPVTRSGVAHGVLCLGWRGARWPGPQGLGLLEGLAAHAAIAFANAAELERRAERDALTGLANHARFWSVLEAEAGRAQRYAGPLSVALFDLDGFKPLNDARGHLAGDRALAQVAAALARGSRASDLVARYGGDEFAAVLPQTALPGALAFASLGVARVRELALDCGGARRLTASAGVAELARGEAPRALLARADAELYCAKRRGGGAASGDASR